jgi:hypothetical protein
MEKLLNYYTAASDQDVLSIRRLKEIINEIPEDKLDFEVVVVAKIKEDLRGIPVSNVILDEDGKQLTIFDFVLRNRLRIEALNAVNNATNQNADQNTEGENDNNTSSNQ